MLQLTNYKKYLDPTDLFAKHKLNRNNQQIFLNIHKTLSKLYFETEREREKKNGKYCWVCAVKYQQKCLKYSTENQQQQQQNQQTNMKSERNAK